MSRPIAIVGGTGPEGSGLALRWVRAGETVIIGSRDAQRAQRTAAQVAEKTGAHDRVRGEENARAVAAADVVVLTVPFSGQASLLKQLKPAFKPGAVLIDTHGTASGRRGRAGDADTGRLAGVGRRASGRTGAERRGRGCCLSKSVGGSFGQRGPD